MTNSESVAPRRLHDARICTSCLQEFPLGRGYDEHQCPGRPVPSSPAPGVPTSTDALLQIIDVLWGELPADVVIRLAGEQPEIVDACRAIHELVDHQPSKTWNPMKMDFE